MYMYTVLYSTYILSFTLYGISNITIKGNSWVWLHFIGYSKISWCVYVQYQLLIVFHCVCHYYYTTDISIQYKLIILSLMNCYYHHLPSGCLSFFIVSTWHLANMYLLFACTFHCNLILSYNVPLLIWPVHCYQFSWNNNSCPN